MLGYDSDAHVPASPTPWPRRAAPRSICSSLALDAGRFDRAQGAEALQVIVSGGWQLQGRAWGLALSRREAVEGGFTSTRASQLDLELDWMIDAAFYAANRLFGLGFEERST